jgi:hypothetical protein
MFRLPEHLQDEREVRPPSHYYFESFGQLCRVPEHRVITYSVTRKRPTHHGHIHIYIIGLGFRVRLRPEWRRALSSTEAYAFAPSQSELDFRLIHTNYQLYKECEYYLWCHPAVVETKTLDCPIMRHLLDIRRSQRLVTRFSKSYYAATHELLYSWTYVGRRRRG